MTELIWANIDKGNGLLPGGTESLPESMLTNPQIGSVALNGERWVGGGVGGWWAGGVGWGKGMGMGGDNAQDTKPWHEFQNC